MNITLTNANIVILANSHNPSIATKDWLLGNDIVLEKPTNFANTPVLSVYESQNLLLVVQAERLQLTARSPLAVVDLPQVVERYVRKLPETPYSAVGLNYIWEGRGEPGENVKDLLKGLFLGNPECFKSQINVEDARVGGIIRFPYEGANLRIIMDIHPELEERTILDFNYHYGIASVADLLESLHKFQSCQEHSRRICQAFLECKT